MLDGIEAGHIPKNLPYAAEIEAACMASGFSPALGYAIPWRETIRGQVAGLWTASSVISPDGGHGLYQLTSSYPSDWLQPTANARYALDHFLIPALVEFRGKGLLGEALIRCIAAAFNAGPGPAWEAHLAGNVDNCTTGHDYAQDVFQVYNAIVLGHSFS